MTRFTYKVTAIEEARDVSIMTLDELMGSLQIFELNLKMNKKEKSISFEVEQHDSSKGNVDAQFCPGYCVYFIILGLGPICDEFSNLGLEPCCFLLFIESLSHLVLVILFRI